MNQDEALVNMKELGDLVSISQLKTIGTYIIRFLGRYAVVVVVEKDDNALMFLSTKDTAPFTLGKYIGTESICSIDHDYTEIIASFGWLVVARYHREHTLEGNEYHWPEFKPAVNGLVELG